MGIAALELGARCAADSQAMNAGVTEAGYLAHARSKFHELWANHSNTLAEAALKLFGVLYDVEREVCDLEPDERLPSRPASALRELLPYHWTPAA